MSLQKVRDRLPELMKMLAVGLGYPEKTDMMAILNQAVNDEWRTIDGFPNYQQNGFSFEIRNRSTYRVLAPNKNGYVKCKALDGTFKNLSTTTKKGS